MLLWLLHYSIKFSNWEGKEECGANTVLFHCYYYGKKQWGVVALIPLATKDVVWSLIRLTVGVRTMVVFLSHTAGNCKHRLLPQPVGCTTRASSPLSTALMVFICQSLNWVSLNLSTSTPTIWIVSTSNPPDSDKECCQIHCTSNNLTLYMQHTGVWCWYLNTVTGGWLQLVWFSGKVLVPYSRAMETVMVCTLLAPYCSYYPTVLA